MSSNTKQEEKLHFLEAGLQRRSQKTCCVIWEEKREWEQSISLRKTIAVFSFWSSGVRIDQLFMRNKKSKMTSKILGKHGNLGSMTNSIANSKGFFHCGFLFAFLLLCLQGKISAISWYFWSLSSSSASQLKHPCIDAREPRQNTSVSLCPAGSTSVFTTVAMISACAKNSCCLQVASTQEQI